MESFFRHAKAERIYHHQICIRICVKEHDHVVYSIKMYLKFSTMRSFLKLTNKLGTPLQYSCLENPIDGGAW